MKFYALTYFGIPSGHSSLKPCVTFSVSIPDDASIHQVLALAVTKEFILENSIDKCAEMQNLREVEVHVTESRPLGVIRAGDVSFSDLLPESKCKAVQGSKSDGGFMEALVDAYMKADSANKAIIENAFSHKFSRRLVNCGVSAPVDDWSQP